MPKIKTKETDKEQQSQIEDSLSSWNKGKSEHEEPEQEEEELETSELETEESEEEESQEEEEQEEEESGDEVVDKLRQRVAELETGQAFAPPKQEEQSSQQEQKVTEKEKQVIEEFATHEEFEEMQTNPAKFNEILLKVYKRARADASEDTLRKIPEVVQATTNRQMSLQDSVKKFYQNNPDLQKHAQYVGFIATQVKSKNPEMSIEQILTETEGQVREHLSLSKKAEETEEKRRTERGKKPAFARRSSGSHKGGKSDTRNNFQKQADDMISALNR